MLTLMIIKTLLYFEIVYYELIALWLYKLGGPTFYLYIPMPEMNSLYLSLWHISEMIIWNRSMIPYYKETCMTVLWMGAKISLLCDSKV